MPADPKQVEAIFSAALEKAGNERDTYLDEPCGKNAALRERVVALLCSNDEASGFLQTPAVAQIQSLSDCTVAQDDTPQACPVSLGETQGEQTALTDTSNSALLYLAPAQRANS